ncbi:AI-2E family transporter [Haladaptatus cibarius]|uniref:AI-2E family transporter n=1 Tax=Haladaptatus cibarius TaxID=453847 RepID=UPI000679038F|nr:AI-2E family transporter [Haladaptatus cibarius]
MDGTVGIDARTVFAWILVTVLAMLSWLLVEPFLSWLLATGFLAFVFFPLHRRLENRIGARLSAGLLSVLVVLVVLIPLAFGLNAALARGTTLLEGFSEASGVQQLERILRQNTGISIPVQSSVRQSAERLSGYVGDRAPTIVRTSFDAVIGFLLLVFVFYYLLKDGSRFIKWVKQMTPLAPSVRNELFTSANDMMWAVLKGHVLVAIIQGFVAGISLFLTGVPGAALLTVVMMVLAIVPIIGVAPVLGGAVVYLFINGEVLSAAFVVIWGVTSVAVTDDYLRAVIIDQQSEMHSAVVFVGVVGGTYLFGAMGLFVGPILLGLFKTSVEVIGSYYGIIRRS